MGRLERACSQELMSSTPRLEIDLSRVTHVDDTAVAVLRRIAERGVVVRSETTAVELLLRANTTSR
jgi:ABC-type transporter Mla MlaB component